jgi:protein TonB
MIGSGQTMERRIRLINPKRRRPRRQRLATAGAGTIDAWWLAYHSPRFEEDPKRRRVSFLLASVLVLSLFFIRFYERPLRIATGGPKGANAVLLKQISLAPPAPVKPTTAPKAVSKARRIPIPDPTPDEPEIYEQPELEPVPEALPGPVNAVGFGLPEGPPGGGAAGAGFGGPGVYQIGGDVSEPEVIRKVEPKYPPKAKANRVQALVILEAIVLANGRAGDIRVLRSGGGYGFDEEAIAALRQWEFRPAMLKGKPVPVIMTLTVEFTLY